MPEHQQINSESARSKRWLKPSQALALTARTDQSIVSVESTRTQMHDKYALSINGMGILIDSAANCKVAKITRVNRLVNAPHWLVGLSNMEGAIVPLLAFSRFFKLLEAEERRSEFALLIGEGDETLGICLDQLPQRVQFSKEQQRPPPPISESLAPYISCSYQSNGRNDIWLELDIAKLLTRLSQCGQY